MLERARWAKVKLLDRAQALFLGIHIRHPYPNSPRPSSSSSPSPLLALFFKKNLKLTHTEAKITYNLCYPSKEYLHFSSAKNSKDFFSLFRHLCTRIPDTTLISKSGSKGGNLSPFELASIGYLAICEKGAKIEAATVQRRKGRLSGPSHCTTPAYTVFYLKGTHHTPDVTDTPGAVQRRNPAF